jgi:hypothetical protein
MEGRECATARPSICFFAPSAPPHQAALTRSNRSRHLDFRF